MIEIIRTSIQFKNPTIGQPTRAVAEHFYARRITARVNGEERAFRYMADELPFLSDELDMIAAIQNQLNAEANAE